MRNDVAFLFYMDFLIMALATFRLSYLIADEDGPFGLLEGARFLVGVRRDPQTGETYGLNNFAVGVCCVWCNSIWVGVVMTAGYTFFRYQTALLCLPFALSAAALGIAEGVKLTVARREAIRFGSNADG